MKTEIGQDLKRIHDRLCCPKCRGDLAVTDECLVCADCHQRYPIADNIPLCFWPNEWASSKKDVTEIVREFYEETPFPNYDDFDDAGSLMQKARQGIFARLLDDQIPFGARILECGCGTGQLSNFLSIANRTVVGTDICLNSLRLGQAFKEHNHLNRIHFFQMNLFRPIFKPETFDVVICNGVLHHTADPFLGYQSIARLVKPKGYIQSLGRQPRRRAVYRYWTQTSLRIQQLLSEEGTPVGELVIEIWNYMKTRKKFWLLPNFLALLLVSALIVTQGSALAPYIYAMF